LTRTPGSPITPSIGKHCHQAVSPHLDREGAAYVTQTGPLKVATALTVLIKLADALAAAHGRDVLHCDVKPANVMLTDFGEPALGDFGIARVSVGRATTTTVGGFSLDHLAPELLDEGRSSPASDVYSLGTTIWELLAGYPPFRRTADVSVGTVIKRIMTQPLPDLPGVPDEIADLLRSMTTKSPDERICTMSEVAGRARALARTLDGQLNDTGLPPIAPPAESETVAEAHPLLDDGEDRTRTYRRVVARPELDKEPDHPRSRRLAIVATLAALLVLALGSAAVAAYRALNQPSGQPETDIVAQTGTDKVSPTTLVPEPSYPLAPTSSVAPGGMSLSVAPRLIDPSPTTARQATSALAPQPSPTSRPSAPPPAAPPAAPVRVDGSSCFATAIRGGLVLGSDEQRNAGGPNYTSAACRDIHIKLTSATYPTYARSCLETPDGSQITECSGWVRLSYPDTWDTLSEGVPAGTRWQIQMYAEAAQEVQFYYTT